MSAEKSKSTSCLKQPMDLIALGAICTALFFLPEIHAALPDVRPAATEPATTLNRMKRQFRLTFPRGPISVDVAAAGAADTIDHDG